MAPLITDIEAARLVQRCYRGYRERKPPIPRFTLSLEITYVAAFGLTLAGRGMPDPYVRFTVDDQDGKPVFETGSGEGGSDVLLAFRKVRLFSKRGRVPHLDLYPTAEHTDPIYISMEYDFMRGLERALFGGSGTGESKRAAVKRAKLHEGAAKAADGGEDETEQASGRVVMRRPEQQDEDSATRQASSSAFTKLQEDLDETRDPSSKMRRQREVDEEAGIILVLGEAGPSKTHFCTRLAQRLRGSVFSIMAMPNYRDATPQNKVAYVRRELKSERPWPRIFIDFAQTRDELTALEFDEEGPRVQVALELLSAEEERKLVRVDRRTKAASFVLSRDGRTIRIFKGDRTSTFSVVPR